MTHTHQMPKQDPTSTSSGVSSPAVQLPGGLPLAPSVPSLEESNSKSSSVSDSQTVAASVPRPKSSNPVIVYNIRLLVCPSVCPASMW